MVSNATDQKAASELPQCTTLAAPPLPTNQARPPRTLRRCTIAPAQPTLHVSPRMPAHTRNLRSPSRLPIIRCSNYSEMPMYGATCSTTSLSKSAPRSRRGVCAEHSVPTVAAPIANAGRSIQATRPSASFSSSNQLRPTLDRTPHTPAQSLPAGRKANTRSRPARSAGSDATWSRMSSSHMPLLGGEGAAR